MKINDWEELLELAKNGDMNAQYEVGTMYEDGIKFNTETIVKSNPAKALKWLLKSHKGGNSNATVRYADYLSKGICCKKNIPKAVRLYRSEIKNGSFLAFTNLAKTYSHENKWKKAVKLYEQIQIKFNVNSNELAHCYYFGLGVTKDKKKAQKLYRKIAKDKSVNRNCEYDINDANYYIGLHYLNGDIGKQSIKKARKYFKLANIDNDHKSSAELLMLIGE